jgi:8-hydroxy-5-deazaflavin:NADPH oxidoreductase
MSSKPSEDPAMTVAIIGAGHVGQALAGGLVDRGWRVRFGVPEPAKYADLPNRYDGCATVGDVASAIKNCEVVILAVPYSAALLVARSVSDWAERILVDATNPVAPGLSGLTVGTTDSGAEMIARQAVNARVVKAFNTTGFENMADPHYRVGDLFMPVAGDDPAACAKVIALATLLGFDAVDAGPLTVARYLEPMAMVWIQMAMRKGHGRHFGFVRAKGVRT